MKYAIIKTGGKQYKVTEGQVIEVEKLETDGSSFVFEEVLLVVDGENVQIGAPTIAGMKVYADVVAEVKGEKIEVFKYKSKSRYRKHTGHRQKYTQLKINGIGAKGEIKASAPKKVIPAKKETANSTEGSEAKAKKAPVKKIAKKTVAKKAAK